MRKGKSASKNNSKETKEKKVRIRKNKKIIQPISQHELYRETQRRAYELYEHRGHEHGCDLEDWREAERLISSGGVQVTEG